MRLNFDAVALVSWGGGEEHRWFAGNLTIFAI